MERLEFSDAENFESGAKRKKNKSKNKRRFSDEQISLLESIFEADTKLEPRRKVQLARELGLQPRQVAIWFQNRRARWRSKQIEQDFRTLRADYDTLASRFESLKEEKQSLLTQLEKLNDLVGKPNDGNTEGNSTGDGSSYRDGNCESSQLVRPSELQEQMEQRESHKNDTSNEVGEYGDDELGHDQLLNLGYVDASVSPQDWHRFDSNNIVFDPSRCTSHWLNFWT